MTVTIRGAAVLVAAVLAAGTARAQAYLGGGLGLTNIESDGLVEALAAEGLDASGEPSDTGIGYHLFAGYMVNDNFGFELRYSDSGDAEDTVAIEFEGDVLPFDFELSLDGFAVYGVGVLPLSQRWDLFGRLGYTTQDIKVALSVTGFPGGGSVSDDDSGVVVAGGARYRFSPNWSMGLELEYFSLDFDGVMKEPLRGALNFAYQFQ